MDPGDRSASPHDMPSPSGDAKRSAAQAVADTSLHGLPGDSDGLSRLLVESVQDYAIFALDAGGHVISWNLGAERLKGYRAEEVLGRHFSIFYPPDKVAERFPQYELEVAARTGRYEDEGWRVRKDGTRFWANVVITALRNGGRELIGFAKVTRDLTERRLAEERAIADARALAEVESTSRAKSQFLAAMSHELRTPLNAIGGYAELLGMGIGGPVSEQQSQYIERIRSSQQHLLAIINDILNFSRIEAGQIEYEIENVPLADVIDSVLRMVDPQAKAKALRIDRPKQLDLSVRADRLKTEQILLNLLSNAVKFTEPGGRITLTASPRGARTRLEVSDTGIGIPAENLDDIFEPFVQVGRSHSSRHEGTGLGLAISRDLARAMGGELAVESTVGEGSTFALELPAA